LSRAFLKSLDPNKPHADVVVPFIKKLEIDFNNQRPDWYVEPVADLSVARQLRLVS
jgi:II/X family phage/plasmid replication protein